MLKIGTHPYSDAPPGGGASRRLASPAVGSGDGSGPAPGEGSAEL